MVRPIALSDIPRAAEVHVFAWRSTLRGVISDQFLFGNLLVINSISRFTDNFNNSIGETFVYDDGIIKGYMMLEPSAPDDDFLFLRALYTDPLMQRGGVGAQMINFFEESAKQRGFLTAKLRVIEGNVAACAFYEKMGYKRDGSRKYLEKMDAYDIGYIKTL